MSIFRASAETGGTTGFYFLDHTPDSCLVTSLEGEILYANQAASTLLDLAPAQLLGREIFELIAEPARTMVKTRVEQVQSADSDRPTAPAYRQQWQMILMTRSGAPVPAAVSVNAFSANNQASGTGKLPPSLLWIIRDHSAGLKIETSLQETALQLENQKHFAECILESIPSSLVVIDRSLRVVSVNHNFLEKTRREEPATLGHRIEEIFPQVLLDYTRMAQRVQEAFHTGQAMEGEKLVYRAAGLPTRTYYYRLVPIYRSPRPFGGKSWENEPVENVMLLMDDVTEREQLGKEVRRVERHLASVVECANDLVVSLDTNQQIITWNHAAETTSGYHAEEVNKRTLVSLCALDQQPLMNAMLRDELSHRTSVAHAEISLQTAKGHTVPIAWSFSPMLDDSGRVAGIVAVGRDLTEQRRMEEQLIHSAKMASLGIMAGGIAHEVRNPLGIISACAQLLLESPDDLDLRSQGLQKIQAATERASLIIENLLKFSRPEGERARKKVNLQVVLEETLALLAHQMALQKVTLRRQYQKELSQINGNSELIQQVFTNLVLNACNAMPEGGWLTVMTHSTDDNQVEIGFSDTGRGIPAEYLEHIFDPFFTTMPVGRGVGLGLSISHSIVKQHQGSIKVQSEPGRGSTFTVFLPVNTNV